MILAIFLLLNIIIDSNGYLLKPKFLRQNAYNKKFKSKYADLCSQTLEIIQRVIVIDKINTF